MRIGALVLVGVLVGVAGGCAQHASTQQPRMQARPTPIAQLNTEAMNIPRIDFCALVPHHAIDAALGSTHPHASSYGDGDRADVTGQGSDVVAEQGCLWSAGSAQARAWTFARPIDRRFARAVVREEAGRPGCSLVSGPPFGQPSLTQRCRTGQSVRVRHAGLFGSTWLTCEVTDTAPAPQVRSRADAWCAEIANTLNTNR